MQEIIERCFKKLAFSGLTASGVQTQQFSTLYVPDTVQSTQLNETGAKSEWLEFYTEKLTVGWRVQLLDKMGV